MSGIFHYTSNSGALGIIESACMFATNYRYLNDLQEISLARKIIVPILQEKFKKVSSGPLPGGLSLESAIQQYGEQVHELHANQFFDSVLKATDILTPIFIASFCRHEIDSEQWENGLLSQWRGYGASGGCALEFEESKLSSLVEAEARECAYTHVSLLSVVYQNHERELNVVDIEGVVGAFVQLLAEDTSENWKAFHARAEPVYKAISLIAPKLKDSAFQEEREVRIVAPCMRMKAAEEFPDRKRRSVHFRYLDGIPIPYIRLFEGVSQLPIKRIIVGPQRDKEKVSYALQLGLEKKEMDVEVTKSGITYVP